MATLRAILDERVHEGELYEKLDRNRVRCYACGHCCPIADGQPGVCKVRFNRGGTLYVPWGYVGGVQCDPIEKKPFFHAYPGAVSPPLDASPAELVAQAVELGAKVIVSTYNEPLITSEWAVAVFRQARAAGLVTGFVSNGNGTPQVLEYLRPWVDLYKVDLKSFDDRHYRQLGGRLQPILETIRSLYQMGFWLEIVTLIIPGFNDSDMELTGMAEFLAGISPAIPWHVTAFHKDYKMTSPEDTPARTLLRAARIGKRAGLHFVYAGNLPGRTDDCENTRCPNCGELLIERYSFRVLQYNLTPTGGCPSCGYAVPGCWAPSYEGQTASTPFLPGRRGRPPRLSILPS